MQHTANEKPIYIFIFESRINGFDLCIGNDDQVIVLSIAALIKVTD